MTLPRCSGNPLSLRHGVLLRLPILQRADIDGAGHLCRPNYIEDCEVCCRPIEVRYTVDGDEVSEFATSAV
jgi:hypothetical protein